jgi:hypothetical protein
MSGWDAMDDVNVRYGKRAKGGVAWFRRVSGRRTIRHYGKRARPKRRRKRAIAPP